MLMQAIKALLPVLWLFGMTGSMFAGQELQLDFFRGVKVGQEFRCEAKADYLSEYYLSGSIESAKTPLKHFHVELSGVLMVTRTMEAMPCWLELKIEKFAGFENDVKYQSGLDGKTLFIRHDGSGRTNFAFKESGNAIAAKDASLLGMIFDLGTIELAGKTIWGYPGRIRAGSTWIPDLDIFRRQLARLNARPEKLEGMVTLKQMQVFQGIDCLVLDMNINCLLADGETCAVISYAVFPADNSTYGPVKNDLCILRKRQIKLPETEPLAAGQIMHSEEKFHLETVMLPLKINK